MNKEVKVASVVGHGVSSAVMRKLLDAPSLKITEMPLSPGHITPTLDYVDTENHNPGGVRDFFNNWITEINAPMRYGYNGGDYIIELKHQLDSVRWDGESEPSAEVIKRLKRCLPRGKQGRWLLKEYLAFCKDPLNAENIFYDAHCGWPKDTYWPELHKASKVTNDVSVEDLQKECFPRTRPHMNVGSKLVNI